MTDRELDKLIEDARGLKRHLNGRGQVMDAHTVGSLIKAVASLRSAQKEARDDEPA
jgi:hypothetical protein